MLVDKHNGRQASRCRDSQCSLLSLRGAFSVRDSSSTSISISIFIQLNVRRGL